MLAIYRRELMAYFNSTLAWVLMGGYLLILGILYYAMVGWFAEASQTAGMNPFGARNMNVMEELVAPLMWWMGFLMLGILPLLTMRLFAEERRSGTLEMLFTYPLSEAQIIGGKFLAAMSVVGLLLAFTLGEMVMLSRLTSLEWPVVGSGYLGLLLVGAAFVSFGLWASSLTPSQMIAAVVSYGGLMVAWLVSAVEDKMPAVKDRLGEVSILEHLDSLARGQLSTHDLVYYVAWVALFLFLTARVLESRKWSR
ncbi:MAG: ABC transporter permease subunit [Armatimonadetes bacterium]|nr:ABC transporter permease subunit [Armatimonadota bacterium]